MFEYRVYATPLYPGSFFSEEGQAIQVDNAEPATVLPPMPNDQRWFGIRLTERMYERWTNDQGEHKWLPFSKTPTKTSYLYVGDRLDREDVAAMGPDGSTLLSNMQGNGWQYVVRTRRGNYQPLTDDDVLVTEVELASILGS